MRNSCEFLEKLSKLPAWCQLSGAELIFMLSWADGSEKYQKIGTSEFYLSYWKTVAAFNANSDIGQWCPDQTTLPSQYLLIFLLS